MSDEVSSFRPRTTSTIALALIIGLPMVLALAGFGAWQFATGSRQAIEGHLAGTAKSIALALDAKLTGYEAAGMALTATDDIRNGVDTEPELQEAARIADLLGVQIVVQEAAAPGRTILNTQAPRAADLLPRDEIPQLALMREAVLASIATRRPRVSGMYTGLFISKPKIAVVLPVVTHDTVSRVVILAFTTDMLTEWLATEDGHAGTLIGIRDGQGRIVAVSRDGATRIDLAAPEWARTLPNDHGVIDGISLGSVRGMFAYQHLALAPSWAVVVACPVSGIASVITPPVRWLLISALAVMVLGVLSLVAIWMRRDSENAARKAVNGLLSDVPALLYVNRVYPDGTFRRRFLSLSAERVTGWSNESLKPEGALMAKIDPVFLPARLDFLREALATGRGQFEYRMRFADGTWHWMRTVGVCLAKDADGSGDVLGFVTDITDERAMREELRRTETFALLGEVAGRISHEMNQPMAAISMAAENGMLMLERASPNLGAVRDKFARIEQQIERVVAIIGHISSFSRKRMIAEAEELDIHAVVQSALSVTEAKMMSAGVPVRLEIAEDLPPPRGVAVLVEQIVINLIVNACDAYMDKPDIGDRYVTISAFCSGDHFILRVSDKAGGIPQDMIGNIFDPFVTSKPPGKGTGLGLSFCLASVGQFGGRMTVENVDGGARFDVSMPIGRARTKDLAMVEG